MFPLPRTDARRRAMSRDVALRLPLDPFFQTSRATKSEIQCIHLCANQDLSIVSVHFLEKQSAKAKEMLLRVETCIFEDFQLYLSILSKFSKFVKALRKNSSNKYTIRFNFSFIIRGNHIHLHTHPFISMHFYLFF